MSPFTILVYILHATASTTDDDDEDESKAVDEKREKETASLNNRPKDL
jgi:hypothetical protein